MTAGEKQSDGSFPDDTFNRRVADRLRELAEIRSEFGRHQDENEVGAAT